MPCYLVITTKKQLSLNLLAINNYVAPALNFVDFTDHLFEAFSQSFMIFRAIDNSNNVFTLVRILEESSQFAIISTCASCNYLSMKACPLFFEGLTD